LYHVKKAERDAVKARIKKIENRIETERRGMLLGVSATRDDSKETAVTAHQRSLERLEQARVQLAETEQVATNVVDNLAVQRETIARTRQNLHAVDKDLSQSNKLVNRMSKWWRG
jgi:Snare region anchored in the vesicle membrane C-terminus